MNSINKIYKVGSKDIIIEILIQNLAKYKKIKNLAKFKNLKSSFLNLDTKLSFI